MSDTIGPALPPHLQKKNEEDKEKNVGIGPALPPWLKEKANEKERPIASASDTERKEEDNSAIGPSLPSLVKKGSVEESKEASKECESFGPSLPPGFASRPMLGPMLPDSSHSAEVYEDDGPVIGPLPPSASNSAGPSVAEEFEKRSKKMKDRLLGREEPKKLEREEWMTELPPLLQGFGGGPRKFRAHERVIGDRSVWTDTPADKARKANQQASTDGKVVSDEDRIKMDVWAKRDAEIAQKLSDASDHKESLMEMHEKTRKRKAEEAEASGEANIRRPFDRELDLQVNKFDEAAKKRMLKQSQGLSSRFSAGAKTSKFL